jgi:DNA mismatch repair protein MutL
VAKVRILPQVLAHQIAAGEVVERPASVVKELVENSLDADANQIAVTVEEGGRRLIQVTDNGCGMSETDAKLAFEHHATSKISNFEDLQKIRSLGFRGEALPSIASVSRTCLRTTDRESASGTEIVYEGGELCSVEEISWVRGTELVVRDLFFNVPARQKFLKTVSTELSHISRQVTGYALANPQVEFRLHHRNRELIAVTAVSEPGERVFQLFGEALFENLVPMNYEKEGVQINGFTSLPHEQRGNGNFLHLYVNRRMVRDRVLTHAIRFAYRDLIPSTAFPVVILFVDVDPESIDVNVHPTKNEIRFYNSSTVHGAILRSIEQALLMHRSNLSSLARDIPVAGKEVRRSVEKYFQRNPDSSFGFSAFRNRDTSISRGPLPSSFVERPDPMTRGSSPDPHADEIPETAYLSPVPVVLGQFVESFVVAADREGIMLVDQHVAHERILYDSALRSLQSSEGVVVQKLLLPTTLELTPQQHVLVEELLDQLNSNGFEVEWFGKQTIVVKGVPALAKESNVQELMESVLEELQTLDVVKQEGRIRRLRERIAISISCRSAIKINTPLSSEKMQWLLDELFRCKNPYTCPHGRPIVLRLNIEEILRGFKRI